MLEWTEELGVGVEELDGQHKRWLEITNTLERALNAGRPMATANTALQEMMAYTRTHFKAEEKLMKETNFSGYERHKGLHDAFVQQLEKITGVLAFEGALEDAKSLVGVARKWFVSHIVVVDKEYAEHFERHGVG